MITLPKTESLKVDSKTRSRIENAVFLAKEILSQLGPELDVEIKLGTAVNEAGSVRYDRATKLFTLTLSRYFIEDLPFEETEDTVKHEVAHILVGVQEGHGPKWRAMAEELGARPERCHVHELTTRMRWIMTCPTCDQKRYRSRREKLSCRICNEAYNPDSLMEYHPNPDFKKG